MPRQFNNESRDEQPEMNEEQRAVTQTLIVLFVVFAVCHLPWSVYHVYYLIVEHVDSSMIHYITHAYLSPIVITLLAVDSSAKIVVYALKWPQFRQTLLDGLPTCSCPRRTAAGDGLTATYSVGGAEGDGEGMFFDDANVVVAQDIPLVLQ